MDFPKADHALLRYLAGAGAALLAAMALWLLVLSFAVHITPDTSIYLLHARTFTETLNRFALSHDSKGIVLMFLLALPVKLLGPTMVAAASSQALAYLVTAAIIIWLWRKHMAVAISLAALWMMAAFSPLMWGGRVRPEDFGMVFTALAVFGALRDRRGGAVLCGAMAAVGFLTKTSLILSPLAIGLAGCLVGPRGRERLIRLVLLGAGLLVVSTLVSGWMVLLDDAGQWFRQALQWPAEYKHAVGKAGLSWARMTNLLALLQASRLQWLFVGSVAGLFFAWKRKAGRWAVVVAVWLLAECGRVVIEGEPWHYAVAGMLPPMVLGCAFFGLRQDGRVNGVGVGVLLVLLSPALVATLPDAALASRLRLVEHAKTPLETLAEYMRPHYRPGEQIMMGGVDYQLLLHLDAPRPYPVLPLHLHAVSEEERVRAEDHFRSRPPEWIVDSRPGTSPVAFQSIGHTDQLAYAYLPVEEVSGQKPRVGIKLGSRYPTRRSATDLPRRLLRDLPYHLVVDTGLHQAWHLSAEL
ncbi:MAG: glycosyltransferase family 39 protein [Kiritimatiellia bacterium]|jgi:hypothetical protein|nr:glycosyltransferase family 39 protein [Kiritimatiellia bacterium]MDP6629963.1 glycosyltransferase family 39 protein [Kiritimatiellia bacterium]MDP6810161.1 glycosyltransferase family 39 protein [Kiritimatiellia bacterium]MDP7023621.1 glycosyltransferase family 39 protein [Kiritimatiellia bacterium]